MPFVTPRRQSLKATAEWSITALLMASVVVSGCATTSNRGPAASSNEMRGTGSEADLQACEEFAHKARGSKSAADAFYEGVGGALRAAGGEYAGAGNFVAFLLSPLIGLAAATRAASENEAVRQEALNACLETRVLEGTLGPEHPDVAQSLDGLADRYAPWQSHGEADALRERALSIRERVFGAESPEVAASLQKLAFRLADEGRYGEADSFYQRALAVGEKAWGPEHAAQVLTLTSYARMLRGLARQAEREAIYGEAERIHQRALAVGEKAWGPEDPEQVRTLRNYAQVLRQLGRQAEADEMDARATAITARTYQKADTPNGLHLLGF